MKTRYLILSLTLLLWSAGALGDGTRYVMRVDGLACPYCAYGIEKKLQQIEGVERIDIDLDKGQVVVEVRDGTELTELQMTTLFRDAGFTYREMTKTPL